ncbi:MAG: hypothetical protein K1X35_09505 [Caulobacteraceae bacterium]|nr:hypothetical protein [Caulobacteraceae bacterium]
MDWKQRRGTSISLGSIGQSPLKPTTGDAGPAPTPRQVAAPKTMTAPPRAPAAAAPRAPAGQGAGSPPVSRAFMSGSLVPPRPLNQRPTPQALPELPKRPAPPASAAQPAAAPQPRPTPKAVPKTAPDTTARPSGRRAQAITPVEPKPEPEVRAARAAASAPAAEPAPVPETLVETTAAAAAPAAPPRRAVKNARQFNAAVVADASGKTARASRRPLIYGAAALVLVAAGAGGAWFMTHRGPTAGTGVAGSAATPVSLSPAAPAAAAADAADDIGGVTEAPSQDAPEAAALPASVPAPALTANGPQRPPGNFEALAPATRAPAQRPPAATRTVEVGPDGLPQISAATRAIAESPGQAATSTAPAAAPAPPPPPPVIRLPSADEPFSTNPSNPDPGG